jgi:hypothetical protein
MQLACWETYPKILAENSEGQRTRERLRSTFEGNIKIDLTI